MPINTPNATAAVDPPVPRLLLTLCCWRRATVQRRWAAMRVFILMLLTLAFAGCSSGRLYTKSGIPPGTVAALKRVQVGMTEAQALDIMKPVSRDWGRLTYGGTGAGELFFQVSAAQQVRLGIEPASRKLEATAEVLPQVHVAPLFVVRSIGQPEPKSTWHLDSNHNFAN